MKTHGLKITKVLKASKDKVFQAWASEQQMKQWMGPGKVTCEKIEMNFVAGGAYQVFMQTPDGPMTAYGEYQTIEPTDKIEFTWGWRQNQLEGTLVSLTFKEHKDGTELTLEHTKIPSEEIAKGHEMGWNANLDNLEEFISG